MRPIVRLAKASAAFLAAPAAALLACAPALQAQSSPVVTFSGEMRTRSEWDKPAGPGIADIFTLLRSRLGARVDAAKGVRLLIQVQDSRVLGAEGNPAAAAIESFDLHQGYLELYSPWRHSNVALRAGRQEIALGNERLIGAANWTNTGRAFDGLRLTLTQATLKSGGAGWDITAFGATVEERGRHFGQSTSTSTASTPAEARVADHIVVGAYGARALPARAVAELTLLGDEAGRYRGFTNANRTTLHARLRSPRVSIVSADVEGALQFGHQTDSSAAGAGRRQDVHAWMGAVRIGTPVSENMRGSLTLGADALSGDDTPHDTRYSAFSTLYATNHQYYGLQDAIGDPAASTREHGLVDALAIATWRVSSMVRPRAELHRFTLASASERDLGWEADVVFPVRLSAAASMDVGFSTLRAGKAAPALGIGAEKSYRNWAYASLRAGF